MEQLKAWMKELDEAGCHGIGFGGGEPTLHPQFTELCQFGRTETELAITATSHGLGINRDLIRKLRESLHFLRISMDGVGKTYESIRGVPFNEFRDRLRLLGGEIPFGINYVVNHQTIGDLDSASVIAEESGAAELLLLPEVGIGRGVPIAQRTLADLKEWVESYKGSLQICISSAHQEFFVSDIPLSQEEPLLAYVHVAANGVLKETSFDVGGVPIGPEGLMAAFQCIRNDSLERII
jgi:MoaA/NifB/PqqE/SkfB family radical SAM enzyme